MIGGKVRSIFVAYRRPCILWAVGIAIAWIGFQEISEIHEVYNGLCVVSSTFSEHCRGIATSGLGLITGLATVAVPYAISRLWEGP